MIVATPPRTFTNQSTTNRGREQPLSAAELRQRREAARKSAIARRARAAARKAAAGGKTKTVGDGVRRGDGDPNAAGYVSGQRLGSVFAQHDVDQSKMRSRRNAKTGYMHFSGKDRQSHAAFVSSLRAAGFLVQLDPDGSGVALNGAGQAIKIDAPGDQIGVQNKRRTGRTRTLPRARQR